MSRAKEKARNTYLDMDDHYLLIIESEKFGVHHVLFDKNDYPLLSKYTWCVGTQKTRATFYVFANIGQRRNLRMHKLIIGNSNGLEIDHKNRNGLDNRRGNLRLATPAQNKYNVGIKKNNTTGYKGVFFVKKSNLYWAYIKADKKRIGGGCFKTPEEAAKKYNELALKYHGDFAYLNEIKNES